jgi:hypothetical protein
VMNDTRKLYMTWSYSLVVAGIAVVLLAKEVGALVVVVPVQEERSGWLFTKGTHKPLEQK